MAIVEAIAAEKIKKAPWMGPDDVLKGMLDVDDLVKCVPIFYVGVERCIMAIDVGTSSLLLSSITGLPLTESRPKGNKKKAIGSEALLSTAYNLD